MKRDKPSDDDAVLKSLLHEWQPSSSLPPCFQDEVSRRIERGKTETMEARTLAGLFSDWLLTRLPHPALAAAYVVTLLAVGAGVGWNQARRESSRVRTELGARYAKAVDPYLP